MKTVIILVLLVSLVTYINCYCSGTTCNTVASGLKNVTSYTKGDDVLVYVHINDTTGHHVRGAFFPLVDEFARMDMYTSVYQGRFCKDPDANVTVQIATAGGSIWSEPRQLTTDEAFVPYFGLVINLAKGVIKNTIWDDNCGECTADNQKCVGRMCGKKFGDDANLNSCISRETDLRVCIM